MRQIEGHLREPLAGARIDATPFGVDRPGWAQAASALAIGLTQDLDPEVGVDERCARVKRGSQPGAPVGRVAPAENWAQSRKGML